jgi:O-antigen ligase
MAIYVVLSIYIYNDASFLISFFKKQGILLAVLLFLPLLTVLWSVEPSSTLLRFVGVLVPSLFALTLVKRLPLIKFRNGLYLLSTIIIITSLLTIVFIPSVGIEQSIHSGLWRGVFHQKNLMGRYFCFLFILSFFSYKYYTKSKVDILLMMISIIFVTASGSATALLATMFSVGLTLIFMSIGRVKQRKIAMLFAISATSLLLTLFIINVQDIFLSLGKDTTFSGRTIIWPKLLDMLAGNWMTGFGFGAFWVNGTITKLETSLYFGWVVNHAHNGFLELILDTGIIGLILFIASFINSPVP